MANCTMCTRFGDCPWQTNPDSYCSAYEQRAMTNADRIRSMTDEELAETFTCIDMFCCPIKSASCPEELSCKNCFMRWLKQEATE